MLMGEIRGINVRSNTKGEIFVGIHVDTFLQALSSAKVNDAGYINIILCPLKYAVRGFSHKPVLQDVERKAT